MARDVRDVQFQLPTLERWHVFLIVGLLVAYVLELVLNLLHVPIYQLLPWYSFGAGFLPWQLATHYLVQGPDVFNVLLGLLGLYFFLPAVHRAVGERQLAFAMIASVVVGVVVGVLVDLTGLASASVSMGWVPLVAALPAIYGLARPDDTILLLFFPVKARWMLWGSLGVALLMVLAYHTIGTWEAVGVWLGVYGWWHLLGPGARRRRLIKKASGIEKELKIRVIEGGKSKPLGRQGDDWIH
jgi:hypothetical protein